ncbi:MAG: alpha-amylase [Promethearchaeota archaeon]|nr:MAG: alpha-amylase [Candidatus Lokiarchaeota archaeon]
MKISRDARNKYVFEGFEFSRKGDIIFNGDIRKVRSFVKILNDKKDLINYPEMAIKIGKFNGMALTFEIYSYLIKLYKEKTGQSSLNKELFDYLKQKIGQEELIEATRNLVKEFPPNNVYKENKDIDEFLQEKSTQFDNVVLFQDEFIKLWLGNENPAFTPYLELYDDEALEKKTQYHEIMEEINNFFEERPKFGPKNQNFMELLRAPIKKYPHSIREQLEYMSENWASLLDKYLIRLLVALDIIREEEMMRGLGPGKAKIYEYDLLGRENYTPDKDWMPKVIMIAKNVYVWMDQLSKKYKRSISKLHEIPNEELDQLRDWGFNALWLIGLWERSKASKTIKRWCGNPEAEASAYSLYDYVISHDLGGHDSFMNLKERAWARGIRLASDMVPNHMGIVSKWTIEHPDWFISLPYPPFPSYSYSGDNLSGDSNIGIYLEDKYFSRNDAAVTFKHVDFRSGQTRYIYHGNDGTSFPWNDTAQLNFLIPEVREAVIQTILHVSKLVPIIRFDAAMTLTRKHYQRLWFPEPGTGGAIPSRAEHGMARENFLKAMPKEFWREVVDRINEQNPDTLLLAEAFWLLEGFFVRTLGMHRVYNSAFMNMVRDEDNAKYRAVMKNTLEFDPKILKRFVNFMNNPDEETAVKQFGNGEKYFGICAMMVTLPGLPMFGHGQIEGFHEKYGMEYRRSYWDEEPDWGLLHHHEKTIFPIMKKRYLFADVKNFLLYDFWTGNFVNEDVFAYSNGVFDERALVIYHNKYSETKGFIKSTVGFAVKNGDDKQVIQKTLAEGLNLPYEGYCIFRDYMTGLEYLRRNKELHEEGLYLELHAYQAFVFMDFRIVQDNEFFHYAQLHDLLGGKGVSNVDATLQEMIYQPLHAPFREIVNDKVFKNLINPQEREETLNRIGIELSRFLQEVKNYCASKRDIEPIKVEILNKLEKTINMKKIIENLQFNQDITKFLNTILPKSPLEHGIIFTWCLIHLLGKVHSQEDYEQQSRSWIDEWFLSKHLESTLASLAKNKNKDLTKSNLLIKILTAKQDFLIKEILSGDNESAALVSLISNPEVQRYLNINRYQNILWFSSEDFENLMQWLSLIVLVNLLSMKISNQKIHIEKSLNIIQSWLKAAKNSQYQVEKLMEITRRS